MIALLLVSSRAAASEPVSELRQLYTEARAGGVERPFVWPAPAALASFRAALESLAGDSPSGPQLAVCGFECVRSSRGATAVEVLREAGSRREGGGVYLLVKPLPARFLVLQAPHSFFDKRSGDIALALFEGGTGSALAVNTVRRKNPVLGGPPGALADVAHGENNFFHAATEALAAARPGAVFVQLHGFEASRRKEPVQADFILSDGSGRLAARGLLALARAAFRAEFGASRVLVWGEDTRELGATTNVQGAMLRQLGEDRFLHVEMAAPQRDRLANVPAERDRLRRALDALLR